MRRVGAGVAVAAVAAGLLTGCSSDDGPTSGLLAMLGKVRATDGSRADIEYGNLDRLRTLAAAAPDRTRTLRGAGLGNLTGYLPMIKNGLGLDLLGMSEAIRVGTPPHWAGLVVGDYDVDSVNKHLADRHVAGDERDDATYWTSGADNEVDRDGPMRGIVPLNEFTKLRTTDGSFAYAPGKDLDWVTDPGDDTLAGDPAMRDLADCLGDVITAHITTAGPAKLMVATGVRATSPSDATEVVCAEPGADRASQLQQRALSELTSGSTTKQVPWSKVLPDARVDLAGHDSGCVRITMPTPPDKAIGTVTALRTDDLTELFGA